VRPGLRTLFISGYSDHAAARQGRGGSDGTYLAKPFTPDVLAGRIRDVLTMSAAA
jgi:DNA-binding response OmpR family regulator